MKFAPLCALVLAVAAPALVHAQSIGDEPASAITVHFADLNLSDKRAARILLARIDDAAMESCGATAFSDPLEYAVVRRSPCRSETVARAVAKIGAPALTAAYEKAGGSLSLAARD